MMKRRALIVSLLALALLVCVASDLVLRGYWREQASRELILAIKANDTASALEALRAHADPNIRDQGEKAPSLRAYLSKLWQQMRGKDWRTTELTRTALMDAVEDDNLEMIIALLDAGAEVDARDKAGETALLMASERQLDVVNLLLARGAKVNAKDKAGWTPLMQASYNAPYTGNPAIVEALLDRGADLNARGSLGETALMLACERHLNVVKLLVDRGADLNAEDIQWHTALDIAEHENFTETIQLLKRHGAKN